MGLGIQQTDSHCDSWSKWPATVLGLRGLDSRNSALEMGIRHLSQGFGQGTLSRRDPRKKKKRRCTQLVSQNTVTKKETKRKSISIGLLTVRYVCGLAMMSNTPKCVCMSLYNRVMSLPKRLLLIQSKVTRALKFDEHNQIHVRGMYLSVVILKISLSK